MASVKENECPICVEKFNKVTRKKIICPFCTYAVCRSCYQRVVLDSAEPQCIQMSCRKTHNYDFLLENMTTSFMKAEYSTHHRTLLVEREIAKLPETQLYIERKKENEQQRVHVRNQIDELYRELNRLNEEYRVIDKLEVTPTQQDRTIMNCPKPECRGLISARYKCGVCDLKMCKKCHAVIQHIDESDDDVDESDVDEKDDDVDEKKKTKSHVCNEDDVKTVQMLNEDSKPCPKCKCRISKIDGCDQMWCLHCKTAFSWKTGRIETGAVHNPEYFRWMRDHQHHIEHRNPNGGCDLLFREVNDHYLHMATYQTPYHNQVMNLYRNLVHLHRVEMPRYQINEMDALSNRDLRLKYLQNQITKEDLQKNLLLRFRRDQKFHRIYQSLDVVYQVARDIFLHWCQIYRDTPKEAFLVEVENGLAEIDRMIDVADKSLHTISDQFKSKRIRINKSGLLE